MGITGGLQAFNWPEMRTTDNWGEVPQSDTRGQSGPPVAAVPNFYSHHGDAVIG